MFCAVSRRDLVSSPTSTISWGPNGLNSGFLNSKPSGRKIFVIVIVVLLFHFDRFRSFFVIAPGRKLGRGSSSYAPFPCYFNVLHNKLASAVLSLVHRVVRLYHQRHTLKKLSSTYRFMCRCAF